MSSHAPSALPPSGPSLSATALAATALEATALVDQVEAFRAGRRDLRAEWAGIEARMVKSTDLNPIAWCDPDRVRRRIAVLEVQRTTTLAPAAALSGRQLAGVFVTVKDLFAMPDTPLRAGTRATLPAVGTTSTVVERLEAAGAIVFAKTQMHEIALGATGENPWTGDVCNPHDSTRQAGGSSSGAAVAVACGLGSAAIGSDTGGSVRIPAAFCGVVGFKPSVGAIPLDGALPLSWTCDHAGPLARSVADVTLLFEVLSRRSARHGRVARRPRLGVPATWLKGRLESGVRDAFERTLARLRRVATVVEVDMPELALAWRCYTPIVRAEAAFVHRAALAAGGKGFSEGVLVPLRAGEAIPAGTWFEAMEGRRTMMAALAAHLADVDAWVLPTTAAQPPVRGQTEVRVEGGTMTVREAVLGQTLPFSFAGVPALSLPAGRIDGLPWGLSLVGARDADAALLALGRWLEQDLAGAGATAGEQVGQ